MRIGPKETKTDINERRVIREALAMYNKDRQRKAMNAKSVRVMNDRLDDAARARDLINRFEN